MAGDLTLLERLLPRITALGKLDVGKRVRFTEAEARELLQGLRGLNLTEIGDQPYTRSISGGVNGKVRDLIAPFIAFLEKELEILGEA